MECVCAPIKYVVTCVWESLNISVIVFFDPDHTWAVLRHTAPDGIALFVTLVLASQIPQWRNILSYILSYTFDYFTGYYLGLHFFSVW